MANIDVYRLSVGSDENLREVPAGLIDACLVIGNFDGVHIGHQMLIRRARAWAAGMGCPVIALIPNPQPGPGPETSKSIFQLTDAGMKAKLLARCGVDAVAELEFDERLSSMQPDVFVDKVLRKGLRPKVAVIGSEFGFGHARRGDARLFEELLSQSNISVNIVPQVQSGADTVSSTAVRQRLMSCDVAGANRLLGYKFRVEAVVAHGDKRGRELNCPTANLLLDDDFLLGHGVYAVQAYDGARKYDAVASFGTRPHFDNGLARLEVHLLDFAGDLYGKTLPVEFVSFIRKECAFNSLEDLIDKIADDCQQARELLSTEGDDVESVEHSLVMRGLKSRDHIDVLHNFELVQPRSSIGYGS